MNCTRCGKMLPPGARFCSGCGTPVMTDAGDAGVKPAAASVSDAIPAAAPQAQQAPEAEPLSAPAAMGTFSGNDNSGQDDYYIPIPSRRRHTQADPVPPVSPKPVTPTPVPPVSPKPVTPTPVPTAQVPKEAGKGAGVPSPTAPTPTAPTQTSGQAAVGQENIANVSFADRHAGSSDMRRFYIIDFLVRMVGIKENIPLFIYLVLNVFIIGGLASLFTGLNIGLGLLIGLVLYILSMTVALSPFGEWLLRRRTECKPVDDPEVQNRIEPIFFEVYMAAKQRDPSLPDDIQLFMNDDPSPNAFATGRRTVCVTKGLLVMSDDEIRATLGHEFGHLSHKDTDRILVVTIGNTFITAIAVIAQIGAIIGEVMCNIMAIFMGEDGAIVNLFAMLSRVICIVMINLFMKVWTWIGVMLCMKTSRGNEYQADEFSYHLGYGEGLISMLGNLGGGGKPSGLFATLAASHPATEDRINRLRHLLSGTPMEV